MKKIYSPEEQKERAAKALSLNGITMEPEPETEPEMFLQLRAAPSVRTKKKPTVRVHRLGYKLKAAFPSPSPSPSPSSCASMQTLQPPQRRQQQQTKLKGASSPSPSSVQIATVVPSHEIPITQPSDPNKKTLVIKTSCLGCGAKATQILHFEPGKEMKPSKNPQILPRLCQACKGDMYCEYSGSALD